MLANLRALFGVIVDIVLLRRGPESLPASSTLLAIVVALNAAVCALMVATIADPPADWQLSLLVGTIVPLLWYRAAFTLAKKRERFLQTATAIFAASTLFAPLLIPLATALLPQLNQPGSASTLLALSTLIVAGWLFIVQVWIVRAAFEWPIVGAILFIFAQEFVGALVYAMLFGAPAQAA